MEVVTHSFSRKLRSLQGVLTLTSRSVAILEATVLVDCAIKICHLVLPTASTMQCYEIQLLWKSGYKNEENRNGRAIWFMDVGQILVAKRRTYSKAATHCHACFPLQPNIDECLLEKKENNGLGMWRTLSIESMGMQSCVVQCPAMTNNFATCIELSLS